MTTHAGPVKRKIEAADLQNDVTDTEKTKRTRFVGPDTQGKAAQYLKHQSIHPNDAIQATKHHGTEHSTNICSLPTELMAMIFSHLDCGDKLRAACVCSCWHDIVDIPSLWRDFCPIIDVDKMTPEHIHMMNVRMIRKVEIYNCINVEKMTTFLQSLPHLKNLCIVSPSSLPRWYIEEKTFPGIKHLTINCSYLHTGVLRSILQPMVNLQDLKLNCILEENLFCALNNSMFLVSLHIKCNKDVVNIGRPSMGNLNPVTSLKRLTINNVKVGNSGLDFISTAFPQLHTLELNLSCDVTSDGLSKLGKLKQLKKLLIRSMHFQHAWYKHIDTELSQLKYLSLHGCRSISNECLQSISKMPVLRVLIVPILGQEVQGLCALSQGCLGLQSLYLGYGNSSINQGLHEVRCMPNLHNLVLLYCSVNDDFWRVNSKSFSKIRSLSFVECELVSEQCLSYLSQMACLDKLLLQKCTNFGKERIKHLGERGIFKALTCLLLVELGIEDDSLVELAKITPSLKKLSIVSCSSVTEDGLAGAVSNLPHLKALEMDVSAGIKDRLKKIQPHLQFYCV